MWFESITVNPVTPRNGTEIAGVSLLGIASEVTAPTYAELYSGEWQHPRCSGYG